MIFNQDQQQRIDALAKGALICIVGARPNFMKIAPIMAAFKASDFSKPVYLLHTGQHYDESMKDSFFDQLGIPVPDIDLEVGSGSHSVQTAEIMRRFEPVVDQVKPCAILVVGDVNSTIACALVAAKKCIPIIHVEAGLRSNDRSMPEEINRILTDQLSDYLFTTEISAENNLTREGINKNKIHFVGNVMIDTLLANQQKAIAVTDTINKYADASSSEKLTKGFATLTLHRPSNVDDFQILESLLKSIGKISDVLPVVFPVHPRTQQMLSKSGLKSLLDGFKNIIQLPPVAYLEMLGLVASSKLVLTDSGGLQEETTALGIPCITLRENTERPITVKSGTNTIVGTDSNKISSTFKEIMSAGGKQGNIPKGWDGKAAIRICEILSGALLKVK